MIAPTAAYSADKKHGASTEFAFATAAAFNGLRAIFRT